MRMHQSQKLFLLLFIPCLIFLILYSKKSDPLISNFEADFISSENCCLCILQSLNTTLPAILIDAELLKGIAEKSCKLRKRRIEIGVDVAHLEDKTILNDERFNVTFFENDPATDFLRFRTKPTRITPKIAGTMKFGLLEVPDPEMFSEYWRRSRLIKCRNINMNRPLSASVLPQRKSVAFLADVRDRLLQFGMFSFLNGGTLLGWYRECGVIPHTSDMDIAVMAGDFNPALIPFLQSNESDFKLSRILGEPRESFEVTVYKKNNTRVYIDVFLMYSSDSTSWVGGTAGNGSKFKYSYPVYDPYCAAELYGHLFWVTCRPALMLKTEYGKDWAKDFPSSRYYWNKSHFNVKPNGRWKEEDMPRVYQIFE
ncbi:unnamed protein product [Caenorhabditis auriculariae]|uniref:Fukutin n=1 Tax=Caenorhabditis auriculariae TaxID=2777116 RepID=A0A8S1GS29_9PELO|nr:unnamed protein product [Caenorhabditis auriculariae]